MSMLMPKVARIEMKRSSSTILKMTRRCSNQPTMYSDTVASGTLKNGWTPALLKVKAIYPPKMTNSPWAKFMIFITPHTSAMP